MYSFTNYLIMYDIADSKRANAVLGLLRGYCYHLQNSIFEGKLRKSQIIELEEKLRKIILPEEDSVIIYPMSYLNILNKITLGKNKYKRSPVF